MTRRLEQRIQSARKKSTRRNLTAAVGLIAGLGAIGSPVMAAEAPLVLEKSIPMPKVPVGPYSDNLSLDLAGHRVFAATQAAKAMTVVDLASARVVATIPVGNPHGNFYSADLKRLFVVDGGSGDLKVFNGDDYSLLKVIPLDKGADGLNYDPVAKLLYVSHGGDEARLDHAILTSVDPVKMEKVAEIQIASAGLEGAALDPTKHRLFVNLAEEDHAVAVVDLKTGSTVATWKLPGRHRPKGIAFDAPRNRLYVACRDTSMHGSVVVVDATTGKVITSLPIGSWVDAIFVDQKRRRIYVSSGLGYIESFAVEANDVYRPLKRVETAILAKTSLYSGETDRLYVDVPHLGSGSVDDAKIMVFRPTP
jgi:DNA-binding beta-propeller fold protein YncE